MNQTFKHFWAHRRQNAWIVVEIALVAMLSFYFLDYFVITTYDTYLCRPAGDFDRDHLVVVQTGVATAGPASEASTSAPAPVETDTTHLSADERFALQAIANLKAVRDRIRELPEVESAGFLDSYGGYRLKNYCAEADTTRCCGAYEEAFIIGEQYFETLGLTPVADTMSRASSSGPAAAAVLSQDSPLDGAVITRSMAVALFGTADAVGRRITEYDYSNPALGQGRKVVARYTVAGVVEDFRLRLHERYSYTVLTARPSLSSVNSRMIIRLRPEADAQAFAARMNQWDMQQELQSGDRGIAYARTYDDYEEEFGSQEISIQLTVMGTFIALLLLNVILGTLGTFWLQIRKRTEDIGIMRSFGAKRRNIFWMLWREAALLTFIAAVIGQIIWLQFAMNVGLAHGFTMSGTGQETDWVNTFWLHFLIVCAVQCLLLLAIVTLGMVVPTFRAMYKRPVEALHHE